MNVDEDVHFALPHALRNSESRGKRSRIQVSGDKNGGHLSKWFNINKTD